MTNLSSQKEREERAIKALEGIAKILNELDRSGDKFIKATNTTVDKFVLLVNKVLVQGLYHTQVLSELQTIISKLPNDFSVIKDEIIEQLNALNINYNIKKED